MALDGGRGGLLRGLFRSYARLVIENEFLSGYSGARTFLVRPIRADGCADAPTIVKLGSREAIRQEFENYEAFVKDRLPPMTARIQRAPVALVRRQATRPTTGQPCSIPLSPSRATRRSACARRCCKTPTRPAAAPVRDLWPQLVDAAPPVYLPPGSGI